MPSAVLRVVLDLDREVAAVVSTKTMSMIETCGCAPLRWSSRAVGVHSKSCAPGIT
jgi:hypothetical protein